MSAPAPEASGRLEARLLEDGGQAAAATDFFRSPGFLAAEEVTHSLVILDPDGERLAATPLLVRTIDGSDRLDAISPYGYPGLELAAGPEAGANLPFPLDPGRIDFSETGLVTVFLRHALGRPVPLADARPRNVCLFSDPELPRKSRMSDRQQIRKNVKRGYRLETVPGPETGPEQRTGFFNAYTETMVRAGASQRYLFPPDYFDAVLDVDGTWLVIARDSDGLIAAASIGARSDGLLHYYLSGTANSHLRDSPMKNVVETMIGFGEELGLPVSFGGGITPGDALETFKRGFANREETWHTSEIVCDPDAEAALTAARRERLGAEPDPGFFPAYRAPARPAGD